MAPPKPPKSPSMNPTPTPLSSRAISVIIPQHNPVSSHSNITEKHDQLSREVVSSLKISSSHSYSTIIPDEQIAEIASWIDNRSSPYDTSNNPYEFQLILRGSRDGFNYKTFWDLCDKQSHTVVILRINESNEILGGYNPLEWDKKKYRGWSKTNDSFIFKLGIDNSSETILSRVQNPDQAIFESYYDENGPNFGGSALRMKDNFRNDKSCVCLGHKGYEKPIRTTKTPFSVDEYEVFKVVNKPGSKIPG
ncbi:7793_t:CDS:1 [Scutellospora calospora]|uniref:7793_t:CDS:1 n=1 Tax=Scutellospora calospora TaxID=85575 RepID=A0ACA9KD62_9GLOM|nr:7793_t:CDS:1 [Scutellospora calospora]